MMDTFQRRPTTYSGSKAVWYGANRERLKAVRHAWYLANHEQIAAKRAARRADAKVYASAYYAERRAERVAWQKDYRDAHPGERRAYSARYRMEHPDRRRDLDNRRRGRKADNGVLLVLERDWRRTLHRFRQACAYCGAVGRKLTQDHVIPIARGGRHSIGNLVPACVPCNSSKKDKLLIEWSRRVAM